MQPGTICVHHLRPRDNDQTTTPATPSPFHTRLVHYEPTVHHIRPDALTESRHYPSMASSDDEHRTVMGPGANAAAALTTPSTRHAPPFITNVTNKVKYRDSVEIWTTMLRVMAASDPKANARLRSVGLMLYLAADDDAKETIKQAETEGQFVLKGSDEDPDRTELVEALLTLIATETPTEKVQREVEMLNEIQTCKRRPSETADVFANRYKACIARYVNQTTVSSPGSDKQWAVMLLRNAMLSPDTLNAITFQLTTGASTSSSRDHTMSIDATKVQVAMDAIVTITEADDMDAAKQILSDVKPLCMSMLASAKRALQNSSPTITLADALAALRQVKISTAGDHRRAPAATMMTRTIDARAQDPAAKRRRIDDLKKGTLCFGCGKPGHWFKDRKACLQEMNERGPPKKQAEGRNDRQQQRGGLRNPDFRRGEQ